MAPGEPRPSTKPQPLGNFPMIFLFTTCALCLMFVLYRRAESLRSVVKSVINLKTWSRREGNIRLSEDDGPSATEFLGDDYDNDNEGLDLESASGRPLNERLATIHAGPGSEVWSGVEGQQEQGPG